MHLECPHCKVEIKIDPSRLPAGRTARVACPKCRQVFALPTAGNGAPTSSGPSVGPEAEAWLREQLAALGQRLKAELRAEMGPMPAVPSASPSVSSPGLRPGETADGEQPQALVATPDAALGGQLASALDQLGHVTRVTTELRAAAKAIDADELAVVVVDEALNGEEREVFKLLEWINRLPGPRRRRLYVAYVAGEVRTLDTGSAFVCGANLTINRSDLGRLAELLRDGIAERDRMYRVFLEVSEAING